MWLRGIARLFLRRWSGLSWRIADTRERNRAHDERPNHCAAKPGYAPGFPVAVLEHKYPGGHTQRAGAYLAGLGSGDDESDDDAAGQRRRDQFRADAWNRWFAVCSRPQGLWRDQRMGSLLATSPVEGRSPPNERIRIRRGTGPRGSLRAGLHVCQGNRNWLGLAVACTRDFPEHDDYQKTGRQPKRCQSVRPMPGGQQTAGPEKQQRRHEKAATHGDPAARPSRSRPHNSTHTRYKSDRCQRQ